MFQPLLFNDCLIIACGFNKVEEEISSLLRSAVVPSLSEEDLELEYADLLGADEGTDAHEMRTDALVDTLPLAPENTPLPIALPPVQLEDDESSRRASSVVPRHPEMAAAS